MVTAPLALFASLAVGAQGAGSGDITEALTGFLVALTVLIHTIVAERTRRQAREVKRQVKPRVKENAESVEYLKGRVEALQAIADERKEAMKRMDRRIQVLMEGSRVTDPHPGRPSLGPDTPQGE